MSGSMILMSVGNTHTVIDVLLRESRLVMVTVRFRITSGLSVVTTNFKEKQGNHSNDIVRQNARANLKARDEKKHHLAVRRGGVLFCVN